MKPLSCLLVFIVIGLSCKKEKDEVKFAGYTATDNFGNLIGAEDPSDWTIDASWNNNEHNLFSAIAAGDLSGTSTGTITISPAYPNPCAGTFGLNFPTTSTCTVRVAIVNNKFEMQGYQVISLQPGMNSEVFALPAIYKHVELYRVYYIFDAEGNPAFKKGHGDLLTQ